MQSKGYNDDEYDVITSGVYTYVRQRYQFYYLVKKVDAFDQIGFKIYLIYWPFELM